MDMIFLEDKGRRSSLPTLRFSLRLAPASIPHFTSEDDPYFALYVVQSHSSLNTSDSSNDTYHNNQR